MHVADFVIARVKDDEESADRQIRAYATSQRLTYQWVMSAVTENRMATEDADWHLGLLAVAHEDHHDFEQRWRP